MITGKRIEPRKKEKIKPQHTFVNNVKLRKENWNSPVLYLINWFGIYFSLCENSPICISLAGNSLQLSVIVDMILFKVNDIKHPVSLGNYKFVANPIHLFIYSCCHFSSVLQSVEFRSPGVRRGRVLPYMALTGTCNFCINFCLKGYLTLCSR